MTDTDKAKKNFEENSLIHLFKEGVNVSDFEWFSADCFNQELSLASADSTIHVVRIYLKVFSLYQTRQGKRLFTRSIPYPMDNRTQIAEKLVDMGFTLVGEHLDDHVFATNECVVSLFDNGYMNCFSDNPTRNEEVFDQLNDLFHITEEIKNRAYILQSTGGGYEFHAYDIKQRELIEDNYMPEVVADLPRLYGMVTNEDPFGRLAVLEGMPGGGKTSLVRGMMNEFGKPKFVVVPPYLVSQLGSPAMVSTLVREQARDPRPLVLVLEDADQVLTKRAGDNMHHISAVLNLSEGILSDTLDIRIVATTNAERTQLDEALTRAGRLGCYIKVPPLSPEQGAKVLARLCDKHDEESAFKILNQSGYGEGEDRISLGKTVVLGDVYAIAARENGTHVHIRVPKAHSRRPVGFA